MTTPQEFVFLFDVDNTLLDNDHVIEDLKDHLVNEFGQESSDLYWTIFESLRAELGYARLSGSPAAVSHQQHQQSGAAAHVGISA